MKLGFFMAGYGHHVASWRHPDVAKKGTMDLNSIIENVKTAERAHFDFVFISDALFVDKKTHPDLMTRFEPINLMSVISRETTNIGLIVTASTTFSQPFLLARDFATLDHISNGRAGWNIVTSGVNDTAQNFNGAQNMEHDLRYDQAAEFVDVTQKLWHSWDNVTFDRDQQNGQFISKEEPEAINHKGQFFQVKGPLNVERSPQGHPLMIQAGSSKKGVAFASKVAEVIFTAQTDVDDATKFADEVKEKVYQERGENQEVVIMPGIFPVIGDTDAEAKANYEELQELILPEIGLELLSSYLGDIDLSGYDLNTPFEQINLDSGNGIQSRISIIQAHASKHNLTLDDVMKSVAGARGHHIIIGTPEKIADNMEEWFTKGAADGFNVMPPLIPTQFDLFVEKVVPILQERGLVQKSYNAGTLREKLGLETK
ncbi:LLM class flavin-dependent oxidoreductase [Staphylococcus kloosii]|uniref:LLM class flavin-dependent oxidoreductase n=1 Tax=Staphylococcus kloosii TaxID=29384 RepID=UPI0028A506F1|nr:LLM class flavin-dependent oxidoreductase [Staphylococcus kloosii]MDT3960599.1 LLM class flavin-dependent oxidoreductase [Staphylococcus kloosii]